ncbi:MAG TPA: phenylpyruvate tautomerase MIF-related protein [Polyangia bacterium]|nr:phenylpyruvate tautomerase MIF-related protein [Polyangia bacterium]
MPLFNLFTSAELPAERAAWMKRLSGILAQSLDKPEEYVMVVVNPRPEMTFGGTSDAACYAELKNVGKLSAAEVEALSQKLCAELAAALRVPADRIYIEFTNADGALWGWDGTTFG